jgi:hypothetical protein
LAEPRPIRSILRRNALASLWLANSRSIMTHRRPPDATARRSKI